jgi:hypothetical protein
MNGSKPLRATLHTQKLMKLPTDGREVDQRFVLDSDAMLSQGVDRAFQVHGVPEDDGSNDQVESACAVTPS